MLKLLKAGNYNLVGTTDYKLVLYLDGQGYYWNYAPQIGELLTFSKHSHAQRHILALGTYRLYDVKDEMELVDLSHLELSLEGHRWQGYLLLTGLPNAKKIRSRIEPTDEVISI